MSTNTVAHGGASFRPSTLTRRSTRRGLVVAWALCYVALLALGLAEAKGVIWFIIIALALAVDGLLFVATRRVTHRPTSALDERERAVRNRAYRAAYLAVFYGMLLVVGGAMLLFYTGHAIGWGPLTHPASHPAVLTGFGIATLQFVSLLPTAIVAWAERDEPGEMD